MIETRRTKNVVIFYKQFEVFYCQEKLQQCYKAKIYAAFYK